MEKIKIKKTEEFEELCKRASAEIEDFYLKYPELLKDNDIVVEPIFRYEIHSC